MVVELEPLLFGVKFGRLRSLFHEKYLPLRFGRLFHTLISGFERIFQHLFPPSTPHFFLVLGDADHIYFASLGHDAGGIGTVYSRRVPENNFPPLVIIYLTWKHINVSSSIPTKCPPNLTSP
uniref:Uncharacterized protein n=1 Tax=Capra hircus TaxID=9925 RepID=A0A8C2RIF5_CAPHI